MNKRPETINFLRHLTIKSIKSIQVNSNGTTLNGSKLYKTYVLLTTVS